MSAGKWIKPIAIIGGFVLLVEKQYSAQMSFNLAFTNLFTMLNVRFRTPLNAVLLLFLRGITSTH